MNKRLISGLAAGALAMGTLALAPALFSLSASADTTQSQPESGVAPAQVNDDDSGVPVAVVSGQYGTRATTPAGDAPAAAGALVAGAYNTPSGGPSTLPAETPTSAPAATTVAVSTAVQVAGAAASATAATPTSAATSTMSASSSAAGIASRDPDARTPVASMPAGAVRR